ncbi:MAG TPA: hypothetical protein VHQ86_03570, partial [Candidatus Saccharimonadia bacterium]|nr:hypothetical protein [Candidatus Saccharimonadia bacterium]
MFSYLRFRYRRMLRRMRRTSLLARKAITQYVDRHIWGKWHQVRVVRRFLVLWGVVTVASGVGVLQQVGALGGMAQVAVPVSGGTYSEAAVGTVSNLNPILPESTAASDID